MAISLRTDFDSSALRAWAKKAKDGPQARRLLALRDTRPSAPKDQRTASAYIFGAICPKDGKGAISESRLTSASRPKQAALENCAHLGNREFARDMTQRTVEDTAFAMSSLPHHRHHYAFDPGRVLAGERCRKLAIPCIMGSSGLATSTR
jgi:hypothetical protein